MSKSHIVFLSRSTPLHRIGGMEIIAWDIARQLAAMNYKIFMGSVPRVMLSDLLCASDVFLFTTLRNEGLPLNVLEALSVGLPVVASNHLQIGLDTYRIIRGSGHSRESRVNKRKALPALKQLS